MSQVTIASVVEGDGEVQAVPVLLRRIAEELQVWNLAVVPPYRVTRSKLVRPGGIEAAVDVAARRVQGRGGVLVLLDADDDCPVELAGQLRDRAQAARPDRRTAVVLANREYEAWLLAAAPSLRGRRGLPGDLDSPANPETIRGAKEWLSQRMATHSYKPVADQAALTAAMDIGLARRNAASFDKFVRDIALLLTTEQR